MHPATKPLAALFALALISISQAQPIPEPPLIYNCIHTPRPIKIDGKLDDPAWHMAPWTEDFIDIEGRNKPKPRYRTRAKLVWDDQYLYIAAELEEPNLQANLTQHDSVIFKDNDFEFFVKPPATVEGPAGQKMPAPGYFEFEINARNTSWDLYLNRPYNQGGKADDSWNIPGLKTAVALKGTLNNAADKDQGWTVEIAIPWTAYTSRLPVAHPHAGSQWRFNFSRVEWLQGHQQPGEHEANWVWSPQGVINMHVPEKWGYLNFTGKQALLVPIANPARRKQAS